MLRPGKRPGGKPAPAWWRDYQKIWPAEQAFVRCAILLPKLAVWPEWLAGGGSSRDDDATRHGNDDADVNALIIEI
ncbi:MAG: hypothetical protein QOK48_348 [Blastocatellia bacterium]|nr:hypothetical protein [Blastocatellia bacterium]